jgi:hypothetical protein
MYNKIIGSKEHPEYSPMVKSSSMAGAREHFLI